MTIEEAQEKIEQLQTQLRQRDLLLHRSFGRFFSDEVLEELLREGEEFQIGGEHRNVSILFTDLRGSTELSEQMEAEAFIRMLNHYFAEMIEIINAWRGNILSFVGDAIVAVFGAPRKNQENARDAVACSVAMQLRMKAVNDWNREQGYPELSMGIGIHKGDAILGIIGSETRSKYDMIGRNVNLASRIQGCSGGGEILASDEVLLAAGEQVLEDPEGMRRVKLKGIQSEITVHSIVGFGKKTLAK